MAKKVFITGISGFAGSYLASHLFDNHYVVSGTYLTSKSLETLSDMQNNLELYQVDLTKKDDIRDVLKKAKPDYVFHLAALTSPKDSFDDPAQTITNNVFAQVYLLEAIRDAHITPRILIVSSADVYGLVAKENLPIGEKTPFMPTNPYAVSKITQDFLGLQYFISYDLDIVRVRPFNHIGPKQSSHFVVSAFAKRIAEIEKNQGGSSNVMHVGDLKPKRDFTDVRDIVVAYRLLLEKGEKGDVYNLGSGVSHQIEEILRTLLSFSSVTIKVEEDEKLIRPGDKPDLVCDIAKIKNEIGWEPHIPLEQTLRDTLDYWRQIV